MVMMQSYSASEVVLAVLRMVDAGKRKKMRRFPKIQSRLTWLAAGEKMPNLEVAITESALLWSFASMIM